jgi:hypothetical protein
VAAIATIGVAVVVAALALTLGNRPDGEGAPSASPRTEPSPAAVSTTSQTPSPATDPTDESTASASARPEGGWQEGGIFGIDGGLTFAASITPGGGGFIAVGTHYPQRPILVVEGQEGRVWHSPDGRSWEDVTPTDTFVDASLDIVFAAADGALIALGGVFEGDTGRYTPMAWESLDGRAWSITPSGFPDGSTVSHLVRDGRGYLAIVGGGLWLSSDGRTWDRVLAGEPAGEGMLSVGAGDEGFVALGSRGVGDATETYAIASSDGRNWIEATDPPLGARVVVPRGGDWIASGRHASGCGTEPGDDRVWSSSDGLEWIEIGTIPWRPILETGQECWIVVVDIQAAGSWLVASPSQRGACCDQPPTPGTPQISRDGRAWESLPISATEGQLGSSVHDAIANGDMLILIGQSNDRAAFWYSEAP